MFRIFSLGSCLTLVALAAPTAPVADAAGQIPEAPDAIAYTTENGDSEVLVLDVAAGKLHSVASNPASDRFARWSPRGGSIAFVSDRDGAEALYVLGRSGVVKVAPAANLDWSWSPDGQSIAWVSHDDWKDLWITDVATGISTNLTGGAREVWSPTWSPDSTLIAFESLNDEGWKDIFAMPRGGGPAVNLTAGSTGNDLDPAWSVDGTEIAFLSQREGGSAIYIADSDGSNPAKLVDAPAVESCGSVTLTGPTWSPDGSRLAYAARLGCGSPVGHANRFYVVDRRGNAPVLVATGSAFLGGGPVWSPDGAHVTVVDGGLSHQHVIVADADGTGSVAISDRYGFECTTAPSWSPDSHRLAFTVPDRCGLTPGPTPSEVFLVDLDAGAPTRVASGGGPAWRPPATGVGLVDPSTGLWYLTGIPPFYYGNPGDIPFVGDWDCDGVDTPGLFRQSDAYAYLRNTNTPGVADIRFFFGNPDDVPVAGDFDGDGCDTLSIYRPSEQRFYIINKLGENEGGLGAADFSFVFGNPGDRPAGGDWDRDGIDEVGLHRESTGFFYWRNTLDTGIASGEMFFGDPGDRFVAGDWGVIDGVDTPAVFRPADTIVYFRHTLTQGIADSQFRFGESSWLPVAGRFGLD